MGYDDNAQKFAAYAGAAARVSVATGWLPSLILAHWALETGYFTSGSFTEGNNIGGIKYVGQSEASGTLYGHAKYDSVERGIDDYIRVAHLSFYKDISGGRTAQEQIHLMHISPWAEASDQEANLLYILNTYGLTGYDDGISAGPAPVLGGVKGSVGGIISNVKDGLSGLSGDEMSKMAGIGLLVVALLAFAQD